MTTTSDKKCETNGFAFVEFVSQSPDQLEMDFIQLGFRKRGRSMNGHLVFFAQGNIVFVINLSPAGNAAQYRNQHGQGVSGLGLYVNTPDSVWQNCVENGCTPIEDKEYGFNAIECIGGSSLYLVDKSAFETLLEKEVIPTLSPDKGPEMGLMEIDHLTHNVHRGNMADWERFYVDLFNFTRIRTFNIKGSKTGLRSVALVSPCGKIRIPINESTDDQSQIEEFIGLNHGEGVQHIAFSTHDIYQSVDKLKTAGIPFQDTPDTYYELLGTRVPNHGENTQELHRLGILLDSDKQARPGKLLQIFTKETVGPLFFEIIQRKGNHGFGEGNFQALFESIELDQIKRGVI